jgi:hypothetical protein
MSHITPELVERCRLLVLVSFHIASISLVGGLIIGWLCVVAKACVFVITNKNL